MPSILSGFTSRADGSIGFRASTPELSVPEKVALMELDHKNVRLLIQPVDDAPEELITVKGDLEHKTPSQRLRGVHYAVWKWEQSQGQTSATFDQFYQNEMERIIQTMKDRLPEVQYHEH